MVPLLSLYALLDLFVRVCVWHGQILDSIQFVGELIAPGAYSGVSFFFPLLPWLVEFELSNGEARRCSGTLRRLKPAIRGCDPAGVQYHLAEKRKRGKHRNGKQHSPFSHPPTPWRVLDGRHNWISIERMGNVYINIQNKISFGIGRQVSVLTDKNHPYPKKSLSHSPVW